MDGLPTIAEIRVWADEKGHEVKDAYGRDKKIVWKARGETFLTSPLLTPNAFRKLCQHLMYLEELEEDNPIKMNLRWWSNKRRT